MDIVIANQGIPGITGEIQVWRERGIYYIGRPDKATPVSLQYLLDNYKQVDGSAIEPSRIPEEWPKISSRQ